MANPISIATMLLATEESTEAAGGFGLSFLMVLLLVGVGLYFMMSLPQRRRQKRLAAMHGSLEIGDEIRTVGGIYGIVLATGDDDITIDVGGGSTLRIDKRAIGERLEVEETEGSEGSTADEDVDTGDADAEDEPR